MLFKTMERKDLKTALTGVVLDSDKEEGQPEIWQLKQPSLSVPVYPTVSFGCSLALVISGCFELD